VEFDMVVRHLRSPKGGLPCERAVKPPDDGPNPITQFRHHPADPAAIQRHQRHRIIVTMPSGSGQPTGKRRAAP
jgi:hypothetical protein